MAALVVVVSLSGNHAALRHGRRSGRKLFARVLDRLHEQIGLVSRNDELQLHQPIPQHARPNPSVRRCRRLGLCRPPEPAANPFQLRSRRRQRNFEDPRSSFSEFVIRVTARTFE